MGDPSWMAQQFLSLRDNGRTRMQLAHVVGIAAYTVLWVRFTNFPATFDTD